MTNWLLTEVGFMSTTMDGAGARQLPSQTYIGSHTVIMAVGFIPTTAGIGTPTTVGDGRLSIMVGGLVMGGMVGFGFQIRFGDHPG